jgi:exosome complex component RRP4
VKRFQGKKVSQVFGAKRFGREGGHERHGFRGGSRFRRDERRPERREQPAGQGEEHAHESSARRSRLVVPGDLLEESPRAVAHAFVDGGKTFSSVLGLYDSGSGKLVPLEGPYTPSLDDTVVGVVTYVKFSGYALNLNSPYEGFLSSKEVRDTFKLGDVLVSRVKDVDEVSSVDLTEASRLEKGEIIEIPAVKIPRVIGKNSSMIRMIQEATGSEIIAGKNGRIWVRGGNSALAVEAILKIEKEAHTSGLTDRVSAFLKAGGSRGAEGA